MAIDNVVRLWEELSCKRSSNGNMNVSFQFLVIFSWGLTNGVDYEVSIGILKTLY